MISNFLMLVSNHLAFASLILCIRCSFMHLLTANIISDMDLAEKAPQLNAYTTLCWYCWCWGIVMQLFSLVDVFLLSVVPQKEIGSMEGLHVPWLAAYLLGAKQESLV